MGFNWWQTNSADTSDYLSLGRVKKQTVWKRNINFLISRLQTR